MLVTQNRYFKAGIANVQRSLLSLDLFTLRASKHESLDLERYVNESTLVKETSFYNV